MFHVERAWTFDQGSPDHGTAVGPGQRDVRGRSSHCSTWNMPDVRWRVDPGVPRGTSGLVWGGEVTVDVGPRGTGWESGRGSIPVE